MASDTGATWADSLKVKPTALLGYAVAIGYLGLFLVVERIFGPHHDGRDRRSQDH